MGAKIIPLFASRPQTLKKPQATVQPRVAIDSALDGLWSRFEIPSSFVKNFKAGVNLSVQPELAENRVLLASLVEASKKRLRLEKVVIGINSIARDMGLDTLDMTIYIDNSGTAKLGFRMQDSRIDGDDGIFSHILLSSVFFSETLPARLYSPENIAALQEVFFLYQSISIGVDPGISAAMLERAADSLIDSLIGERDEIGREMNEHVNGVLLRFRKKRSRDVRSSLKIEIVQATRYLQARMRASVKVMRNERDPHVREIVAPEVRVVPLLRAI